MNDRLSTHTARWLAMGFWIALMALAAILTLYILPGGMS